MKPKKILIVEDNSRIYSQLALLTEKICEQLGLPKPNIEMEMFEADAIKKVRENNYDLITLSTNLALEGKGTNVFREIPEENYPKTIYISFDKTLADFYKGKGVSILPKEDIFEENLLPLMRQIFQTQ